MTSSAITVVILTMNEERHLAGCLESIKPLNSDVLVVDSGSTDQSVPIAKAQGATVVHETFLGFASQRNKALDMVSTTWTLFLDADERLTPDLCGEIRDRMQRASDDVAGFWIPRRNLVVGRPLRGGGWWPDLQARLIRTGFGRYEPSREVHEVVCFEGDTEVLTRPIIHVNYESWSEVLTRQRQYTLRLVKAGLVPPPRPISWFSRPAREFVRRFVRLRGYRDGLTGFALAGIMALEEVRGCILTRQAGRA